jgi:hypothetical protein
MMSREQRIEYEILDCALNQANHSGGHHTAVILFMARLQQLFPGIEAREFRGACKELVRQDAVELAFPSVIGYRHYRGASDDTDFSDAKTLRLATTPSSRAYFHRLSALIEAPAGFRRPSGFRRMSPKV